MTLACLNSNQAPPDGEYSVTTSINAQERYSYEVHNPRTGDKLYTVEEPAPGEITSAYERARAAAVKLGAMTVRQRLDELRKLQRYILNNRDRIARRICEETGKCINDAMLAEIFPALDIIAYYDKHAEKMLADRKMHTPIMLTGKKSHVIYEPLGVVLIISPWNYPFNLSFLPWVGAFVAGNAAIMKPSKETPLRGLMEEMIAESGFMPDALQVAYASRRTADLLIEAKPDKIHFTGSVGAGRKIMAKAAELLIPVELELGGKDPMIVFEDTDLERAVNGALWGCFVNSGQTCTSVERIFVHQRIYDAFLALFKEKTEKIITLDHPEGRADEFALTMGCMTAEFQIREIEEQLEQSIARGARVITGGTREPGTHRFKPTIIVDVTPDMPIQSRESFGPVVTVTPFQEEDEVIRLANDSPYGLSASVWSGDLERAWRVARRLVTGNVSINNALATQANPALPFGGIKDSGFGRYKGEIGLHAFSNIKSIQVDRNSNRLEGYWYPYSKEKFELFSTIMEAAFGGGAFGLFKTIFNGLKLERFSRRHRL